MGNHSKRSSNLPPEQAAIQAKCFHPSGKFDEFQQEDVEKSIPDRFEKIARRFPNRIAVKNGAEIVTYAELNVLADQLACGLLNERGGEGETVGLLFDVGTRLIAAMLGVLKAGKFFVLLDPSLPKARIVTMLEDAQAEIVISDQKSAVSNEAVAAGHRKLMTFDEISSRKVTEFLPVHVPPTALAFISFTSGSTGQPKAVMQNHRNLLHQTMLYTNGLHICQHDRIASLAFAVAIFVANSLLALLNGATLLFFDVRKEGAGALSRWLLDEGISFCWILSALFRSVCQSLTADKRFRDLRALRVTTEVSKTDIDLFRKHLSLNCVIARGFSSTETHLLSSFLIDHRTEIIGDEVPVGYAVEDKEILLLNSAGEEVGFNEIGEIAVRSRYLSPGYWGNTDLTKAKFKSFSTGGEERLYLSGDLGLMLPDGCLMYKGRKDFQIKIRGYNVSLIEVDGALLAHPQVKEAGVAAWDRDSGEKYLAAYVVPRGNSALTIGELRGFLSDKLPDYMIPSAFMFLEALPLTNGKLDRKTLPKPSEKRPEMGTRYIPPRNESERKLVEIWQEILAMSPIGIRDNFFDLGGDSLAAGRVVFQVSKQFQIQVPLHL